MAAATFAVTVNLRFRWWVWPYLHTLAFLCSMFSATPDMDRVVYWVQRGIILEIVPA